MPKVTIREIDNTGSETAEFSDYTVLVPGLQLTTKPASGTTGVPFDGGIIDNVETFKSFLWSTSSSVLEKIKADRGFALAYELVRNGLTVYYKSAYSDYTVSTDGVYSVTYLDLYDEDGKKLETWDPKVFFKPFADKSVYDLRFITIGGLPEIGVIGSEQGTTTKPTHPENAWAALKCAGDRGDAVAVLNTPSAKVQLLEKEATGSSEAVYSEAKALSTTKLIDKWVQQEFGSKCNEVITRNGVSWLEAEKKTETYGRYGAIFAPICTATIDGVSKSISAVQDYLVAFSHMLPNFPTWFAAAGSVRGISGYVDLKPTMNFGDADVDILQRRTTSTDSQGNTVGANHIAINVISNVRPYGYVVWGNRTMHPLSTPSNGKGSVPQLVASSFLNIRHLCIDIKKTLYRASRRFTFEPNSDTLWFNFKAAVTPLLDEMKANQGINGYQIIKVKTNKKALLVARIRIIPIEAVEDFDLTIELTDSLEPVVVNE